MRNRLLQIDIAQRKFKALSYKQYDSNNELDIVVYENKVLMDISNYIAKVYFELPSGKNYVIDGTIKNNTIHTLIPKVVLSEHGQVTVECRLISFDVTITSFAFYFNVEKSIDKDGVQDPNVEHTHENKDTLDRITDNMVDMMELNMGTVNLDSYQLKRDTGLDTDDKTIVGAINELNEKIENVDFSGVDVFDGDYNSLTNKPTIPTKVSQLENDEGYLTKHQDISGKVDKISGKGLSTNDLTNSLKNNYDEAYNHSQENHAPVNAEKNVQSDWNETNTQSDAYILNKPDLSGLATKNYVTKVMGYYRVYKSSAISV